MYKDITISLLAAAVITGLPCMACLPPVDRQAVYIAAATAVFIFLLFLDDITDKMRERRERIRRIRQIIKDLQDPERFQNQRKQG